MLNVVVWFTNKKRKKEKYIVRKLWALLTGIVSCMTSLDCKSNKLICRLLPGLLLQTILCIDKILTECCKDLVMIKQEAHVHEELSYLTVSFETSMHHVHS